MKNAARIIGLVAIIVVILGAIIASMNIKPSNLEQVWDQAMTVGNPEAKNYFIIYSDLVCPYCLAFENAIVENEEEFQQYIADNDILLEVRLSDFLYEYGETQPEPSRYSALGAYCAKNEGKFWDYYNNAVSSVWNDFFKDQGKSGGYALVELGQDYWIDLGKEVGLGDSFVSCVENEEPLAEIQANAEKTAKMKVGMPYFKFNNFTLAGFDMAGDWDDVKNYFALGLSS